MAAIAQTEKGTKFLGASVGNLSYRTEDNSIYISAAIYPSVGVFVVDNLLLGSNLRLGYERSRNEGSLGDFERRTIVYGLSPFVRYYFAGSNAHRFFGQISGGITWYNTKIKDRYTTGNLINRTSKEDFSTFGGALGYNYFLTPSAALEVTAGYTRDTNGPSPATGVLDIRAGFVVFLPSKKAATAPTQ